MARSAAAAFSKRAGRKPFRSRTAPMLVLGEAHFATSPGRAPFQYWSIAYRSVVDAPPMGARNPAILYGLGNLLENAQHHAGGVSKLTLRADATSVCFDVIDAGGLKNARYLEPLARDLVDPRIRLPIAARTGEDHRVEHLGTGLRHRLPQGGLAPGA